MKKQNRKLYNIRRAAEFLRLAFANDGGVSAELTVDKENITLKIFRAESNFHATNILRALEIGEREKSVFADSQPWHTLNGSKGELNVTVFAAGLPPSCKLVEVIERIPKTNVVETPVEGEFIEVKRLKTVCG